MRFNKSWAYGAGLVFAMHLLWFALILTQAHVDWVMPAIIVLFFVTMNVAGLAAFVTAWLAPRHGFRLALSMAPLTALLATLFNILLQAAGTHVDFSGFRGNLGLFAVSLAYGVFVSAVGGGIGLWWARRHPPNNSINPAAVSSCVHPSDEPLTGSNGGGHGSGEIAPPRGDGSNERGGGNASRTDICHSHQLRADAEDETSP